MVSDMIGLFLFGVLMVALGAYTGQIVKQDIQKSQCPFCSCRNCCSIGVGVPPACKDEEQKPFVCMRQ